MKKMKKAKRVVASVATASMLLSMIPAQVFGATSQVASFPDRLGGLTQYNTAALISGMTQSSDYVILAAGMKQNLIDALAAGPLASYLKAPILLTEGDKLSDAAKDELKRLNPKFVYITSGNAVIKQQVYTDLAALNISADKIKALGGFDQFETSVNIAKEMTAKGAKVTQVALATGYGTADALSVAPIAGAQTMPILLTEKDKLPKSVSDYVDGIKADVKDSFVIGGTAVVSDAVKAGLPGTQHRYSGNDAYDTNGEVLANFENINYEHVFVANADTSADALAGAPLAAQYKAPIILTDGKMIKGNNAKLVNGKLTASSVVTALGGAAVVPNAVRDVLHFEKAPTLAETSIQGFVNDAKGAVSGAVVTSGQFTTSTDKNGYYKLAVDPGIDSVTVQKDGYFVATQENIEVSRNYSAAYNVHLAKVDADLLYLEGHVVDSVTGKNVTGAQVVLQASQGGKWVDVDKVITDAKGGYGFYNSAAVGYANPDITAREQFKDVFGNNANQLSLNTQYQVVVSKALADSNLNAVYKTQPQTITTSKDSNKTTVPTLLVPVAKINQFNVAAKLDSKAIQTATDLKVEFLNTDGTALPKAGAAVAIVSNAVDSTIKEAKVDLSKNTLTLPTGKYFLKLSDGQNAVEVVAVDVTEGKDVSVSTTINAKQNVTVNAAFKSFNVAQAQKNLSSIVATAHIYQTVDGVDISVADNQPIKFALNGDNTTLTGSAPFANLDALTYKVVVDGDYVIGAPSTNVVVRSGAVNNGTLDLNPAGAIAGKVILNGQQNSTLVPVTVALINAVDGKTVSTYTMNVIRKNDGSFAGDDLSKVLKGITPGAYKLQFTAAGYKDKTVEAFNVVDFETYSAGNVALDPQPGITVSGYVRFASDLAPVKANVNGRATTVTAYNTDGYVAAVSVQDDGTYNFTSLKTGAYTLVVRGPGQFETIAQTVNVNNGANTSNFAVQAGGKGLLRLSLVDTIGNAISGGVTISDKWYVADSGDQYGQYEIYRYGSAEWDTDYSLSAGTYTVSVTGSKIVDTSFQVSVANNGTTYKTATISLKANGVTHQVSGTVNGPADGWIVVLDSNGNFIDKAPITPNFDVNNVYTYSSYVLDLPNGNYTLAVVDNYTYVETKAVSVQDFDIWDVNFAQTFWHREH